jgi:hypothetical protein
MSWSAGAHLYTSHEQLATELPTRLAEQRTIVLKQYRGMGAPAFGKLPLSLTARMTSTGPYWFSTPSRQARRRCCHSASSSHAASPTSTTAG